MYLNARDKDGQVIIHAKGQPMSKQESFRWLWLMRGLTETEVKLKWKEYAGRSVGR